ncbi:MAG TPA: class III extradiol ring-cleavage dioxygenase [Methanobacteriaceae archaeon]|nr:class III extradiol ring-cleavage dioxygenase [Methanobacteriaceae archaeon]
MAEETLPTLFVSHGAPTLPLDDIPARNFLKGIGKQYSDIKAVLCISAHWETTYPAVNSPKTPETIHDFYGFPEALYEIEYPAQGSPKLAERVLNLLKSNNISCDLDRQRGLDHGTWVPLMLMYPNAEIPVVQLSIQHHLNTEKHLALGRAIGKLRHEGILIIGSGGAVHPLGYAEFRPGGKTDEWALEFDKWLTDAVTRGDERSLVSYRNIAPYPERAHPRPDHYMPLLVAFGAAGKRVKGTVIHKSWQWGDLGMAAYSFDSDD